MNVQPTKYVKETMQSTVQIPAAKGGVETTYPFQWLLMKPQAHAVEPFVVNESARGGNVERR